MTCWHVAIFLNATPITIQLANMQSIIRRVKSVPALMRFSSPAEHPPVPPQLSYSQLCQQVDRLEELIDAMIEESHRNHIIPHSSASTSLSQLLERLIQQLHRKYKFSPNLFELVNVLLTGPQSPVIFTRTSPSTDE